MELTDSHFDELIELCTNYCSMKNLMLEDYLEGIFNTSKITADPYVVIMCLIKYHREWIAKGV